MVGYAAVGTQNVLSAQACCVQIPGTSSCTPSGTSFATPFIANLVAQTYDSLKAINKTLSLPVIANNLWQYQNANAGTLPSVAQLVNYSLGTTTGTTTGTTGYRYANWNCNGSSQCATDMGGPYGSIGPFCTDADAHAWGDKFIPGGYKVAGSPTYTISNAPTPKNGKCYQSGVDF